MKKIQALNGFWFNGAFTAALYFKTYLIYDNLDNTAKFYYEFLNENQIMLVSGNFDIDGDAYTDWDGSNSYVWDFAVNKFGIILDDTK